MVLIGLALATFVAVASVASAGKSRSTLLPPPVLRSAPGWVSLTTGPTRGPKLAPQVWAITARTNLGALVPLDLFNGLRKLEPNAVVLWAFNDGRSSGKSSSLPLRLADFRVDRRWEGQPASKVQQRFRWTTVHGWHLAVYVYFGTQHPNHHLLAEAQAELSRLRVP